MVYGESRGFLLPSLSFTFIEFIEYLCKINIVRNETIAALKSKPSIFDQARAKYKGYSKDPVTVFQHKCKNSPYDLRV